MKFIEVNIDNIEDEHICCAISDKKGDLCVTSKKEWMKKRFNDGLRFIKLNERGKVFIEFIPAEKAFAPIEADGYMYINCFWVSGKFKGQGISNTLLEICITEAKKLGMKGLVILSSNKKKPFLSDPKHLKYKGFIVGDTAMPYYELLYLPFDPNEKDIPRFNEQAKRAETEEEGVVVYYSNQCPHTSKYVPIIENAARDMDLKFKAIKLETYQDAKSAPCPFTTYSLYVNGKFVTNEILTDKKFALIINSQR